MSTWTKVDRQNAAGLRGQELLPGRTSTAGCRVNPSSAQDLPHGGGCDRVGELDEFALHPPVPPRRIVRRHADHELADRSYRGDAVGSCNPICARPGAGARPGASPGSRRTPRPTGGGGSAGRVRQATSGRPAGSRTRPIWWRSTVFSCRRLGGTAGAVSMLPASVSRDPPAAPGVRLSSHRALHASCPVVSRLVRPAVPGSTGSGCCRRDSGSGSH